MNKYLLTLIALLCLNFSFGQSEVIISQYIETNSGTTPKGIEIFNVSGVDITFSPANNLQIYQGTNGASCSAIAATNITSGTLLADQVWVIGTSDLTAYATTNGTNLSGTTTYGFTFNGDDALAVYLGGTIQDMFGLCGIDPGSSWSGSGVSTANNNLQVLDGLCDGDIDGWSDPSTRFTQIADGLTMTGFGDAPAPCGSVTPADIILNSANPATSATNITQGNNDTPIYVFDLSVSTANATLTDVFFTTTGTYAASNITNFKLWYSTNATFDTSTDTLLNNITTSLGPGTHTFTGFSQLISNGSTGYLFITTDIPCTSTNGNTIQVNALLTTDLTFVSAGSVTGTAYNSDTHTIQTATPSNVIGLTTSLCENNTTTVDWTLPTDCYDNILVFATDTSFSTATPTGNGGTYTASTTFGAGTAFDGGFCIYKGTGTTETIIGLTNGTTYTYKVFTRNDLEWSNGVEVSCTPVFAYCSSGSTNTADSEIENVTLVGENNTISNNTTDICSTGVNDYTSMSADLNVGGSYTLTVEFGDCDNGTQYNGAGGVWIDWNSDGDFDDLNETITTLDVAVSGGNVTENITINVPVSQPIGNYRMRIVQEESGTSGSISPCGTFSWGSTEDYTIEVISACIPTQTIVSFTPTSGPIGTTVTITGTGFTSGSTVDFNGVSAAVTFINTTTLTAIVPSGTTTGVITVTESGCPVDSATNFTLTACTPSHSVSSFTPTSGPELTEVTITGTGFTASTTVDFNGTSATIISQTATQIIAEVPAGATSGTLTITESGCALDLSPDFTILIDNGCSSGSAPSGFTDLLFSGIYDETSGSCHYIELFNPTSSAIDLSTYAIGSSNNQTLATTLPATYNGGTYPLSGTIQPYSTFLILATSDTVNCESCTNVTLDLEFLSSALGYNGFTSANYDKLILLNGTTPIDLWSNGDGHDNGYIYTRLNTASAPALVFSSADWNSSTTPDCFNFAISSTPLPSITSNPSDTTGCSSATFSVAATPGNSGTLTYQWKYNDGSASGWNNVTSANFLPGTVTGETTNTLTISGFDLNGYQFYCEVIEDSLCGISSDAAQFKGSDTTTWSAGSWDNGAPDLNTTAIINDTYNTVSNGNIEACSLYINSSYLLTVGANSYVKVQTSIYNNGELLVQNEGSVIQIDDAGIYDDSGSVASNPTTVEKLTAILGAWYEYTYWSSPVTNETIGSALFASSPYRRFSFNAGNFVDSTYETNNNNATVVGAGIDDIDDDANDWQLRAAGDLMTPGVGYAATHSPAAYTTATNYNYSFRGPLNTGVVTVPVERNDTETGDTNWNLIGNPYPSAIDAKLFFDENNYGANPSTGTLDGAIYLWSHSTPPSVTNNGNEQINFDLNDYITLNYTGASVTGVTSYISSGQGFFVTYSDAVPSTSGTVTFNNSMRVDGNNNQFFRASNVNASINTNENKLWLKLTNDFGLKDNIMVGYVNGATAANDGAAYDAKTNGAYTKTMTFYSLIPGDTEKLSVQGKATTDLNITETIYIGFLNNIGIPTVYTISIDDFEGDFLINNTAYLIDNLLNTYHDLSASDYSFTSEVGEFNDRFEIVFTNPSLSIDQFTSNEINTTVISLPNDEVKFIAPKNLNIKTIIIYDTLGREIIDLKGRENTETYHLSTLSQSVYLAEIELSNNQKIIKKFVKK